MTILNWIFNLVTRRNIMDSPDTNPEIDTLSVEVETETPSEEDSTPATTMPSLDISSFVGDIEAMFTGIVADMTNPAFQGFIQELAEDAAAVASMSAAGVDDELIARAKTAIQARAQSLTQVPGLIAASRVPSFMNIATNVSNVLIGFGFNVLRTYAGLPPA